MKYRVSVDRENRILTFRDVLHSNEELFEGFNEVVGENTYKVKRDTRFFSEVLAGIFFGDIIEIKGSDGHYFISWIDDKFQMHDDELELESIDHTFDEFMQSEIKWINKKNTKSWKKIRKCAERASEDGMFKKCWDWLIRTGSGTQDIDKKTLTEMYKYIKDNEKKFHATPLKDSQLTNLERVSHTLNTWIVTLVAIASLLFPFEIGIMIFVVSAFFLHKISVMMTKKFDSFVPNIISDVLKMLEKKIDHDYLKELETEPDKVKKKNFISLVNMDLDIVSRYSEFSGFRDSIENLGISYSSEKYIEIGEIESDVEVLTYVEDLLNIEMDMYASNKRFGTKQGNSIIGLDRLYNVLECLGYGVDEVRKDKFIEYIRSIILGICEKPYEGCEIEITELIRLVVRYVTKFGLGKMPLEDESVSNMKSIADNIFYATCYKYTVAKRTDELVDKWEKEQEVTPKDSSMEDGKRHVLQDKK